MGHDNYRSLRRTGRAFVLCLVCLLACSLLSGCNSTDPRALEASWNLEPAKQPNASEREKAVRTIGAVAREDPGRCNWSDDLDGSLKDPDAKVRSAAVEMLSGIAEAHPDAVYTSSLIGIKWYAIDIELLNQMGLHDPEVGVRKAVASFWVHSDVIFDRGIKNLQAMISTERDPNSASMWRNKLAERIERSFERNQLINWVCFI